MATKKLQILGQLGEKFYKQNEEPENAEIGSLWIDLDEDNTEVSYSKAEIDAIMDNYINDIDTLIGGDA